MIDEIEPRPDRTFAAADGGSADGSSRGTGDKGGDGDREHGGDHGRHREGDHHEHHEGHEGHEHHAHDLDTLGVAVATISSSRSTDEDRSGDIIVDAVESEDHSVVIRELIPDDYDTIQRTVDTFTGRKDVDVVITTGGTGVTPDDITVEAVVPLLEKELPGFGELFRRLSYDEIGARIVGTRAIAGIADGVVVFCLPGSSNAVRLGTESIILEVATHLAGLAKPADDGEDG